MKKLAIGSLKKQFQHKLDFLDLTWKKKVALLLFCLSFGILLYFSYRMMIEESLVSLSVQQQELELKKRLLQIREERQKGHGEIQEELLQYQADLKEIARTLIPDPFIGEVMIQSTRLMEVCGLRESALYIQEKETLLSSGLKEGQALYRISFRITGIGTYENAFSYIESLKEASSFYEITHLRLSSKQAALPGEVLLELRISIYGFQEADGLWTEPLQPEIRKGNPFYYRQ